MIGERLYELRKNADLTQDALSSILNINKHSISSYERNKSEPSDEIKILIANYFQVSVDYLLGLTDHPHPYKPFHNVLILPPNFPDDAKTELHHYADYLAHNYRKVYPDISNQHHTTKQPPNV